MDSSRNGNENRPESARDLEEMDGLTLALARSSDAEIRDGNHLELFENGPDTYDDWLERIASARRWVHLENYIFDADETGNRFAEALKKKASEGIPVRVIYDWFGCADVHRSFWNEMRSAGVEVRVVNPPNATDPLSVARRDHRKLLAIDAEYASTGGVCISDGWLVRSPETGLIYRDTAVSVSGPVVADLERAFAGVWDLCGDPLPDEERPFHIDIEPTGEVGVRAVIQEPGKMRILRVLQLMCAGARERIWISDAYFLSTPALTQSLLSAAKDGVDVRVLVPATNDLPWIGVMSRTGYRQFLEAGVRIFEYGGPMMHAKTTVIDGWWSKVGSTNMNVGGLINNWEIDLVAEDRGFGSRMEEMFRRDLENAREIRLVDHGGEQLAGDLPTRVQPDSRLSRDERKDRRRIRRTLAGSGSGATATVTRVGSAALQQSAAPINTYEHAVATGVSGVLLLVAALSARFPKVIAWPLALVAGLIGVLGIIRSLNSTETEEVLSIPARVRREIRDRNQ